MVLKNEAGEEVASWTSTTSAKELKLEAGTYTLIEEVAPAGYEKVTTEMTFTVTEEGKVTLEEVKENGVVIFCLKEGEDNHVILKDAPEKHDVKISKTDMTENNGEEIPGAVIELRDSEGNVIDKWTSSIEGPHEVTLPAGEYVLEEVNAPEGFQAITTIIKFSVDEDGKVTLLNAEEIPEGEGAVDLMSEEHINIKDMPKPTEEHTIKISKTDMTENNGGEIPGAVIELRDSEGNVIDKWTSSIEGPHEVTLPAGEYVLEEVNAPEGFQAITTIIKFSVDEDGKVTLLNAEEIPEGEGAVDLMSEEHINIQDMPQPKEETEEFPVKISKTDLGGTEVPGAKMTLVDENGQLVHEWTSEETAEKLQLKPGTYTMIEVVAPEGFLPVTTAMTFIVEKDGNVELVTTTVDNGGEIEVLDGNHVILKDAPVQELEEGEVCATIRATKVLEGKELVGGEFLFELVDEDGKVVASARNDEDGNITFENVGPFSEEGEYEFTLREVKGDKANIDYDKSIYKATVTVIDVTPDQVVEPVVEEVEEPEAVEEAVDTEEEATEEPTEETEEEEATEEAAEEEVAEEPAEEVITKKVLEATVTYESGNIEFVNKYNKIPVLFSKTDLGGTELKGAQMKLVGPDDFEVEWTSIGKAYEMELEPGVYIMTEVVAPEGYWPVTTEIEFEVKDTGVVVLKTTVVNGGGEIEVTEGNHVILKDSPAPPTPGTGFKGQFSIVKTVSGIAEEDKEYKFEILFTYMDGTTETKIINIKPNEDPKVFKDIPEGTVITITEDEDGYEVTYLVDGKETNELTITADCDIKVIVNNYKPEEVPEEEEEEPELPPKDTPDNVPPLPETPGEEPKTPEPKTPMTGDDNAPMMWIGMFLIAGLGLALGKKAKKHI